ncbi:major facilitator superfamily domain-containing protein [Sphaerosporella brunnea]|uniref:Major facilitator superfamily domain-containing protein n=1 Tax=Sphaerosporella brunnea TaxID=1250544 RepID=A0A5J5EWG8_9PEZI|nr:major facilitator superfamily domain-containing protein [Sphaerosporella brunnea]
MASTWAGTSSIAGSTESLRMILLTVSLTGVQLVWGVEMAYCAPYLLSLGLTKSLMSLIWNVGPISGMICQPIVGVLADRNTSRWGRRRPILVIGSLCVGAALLTLGWTREIVGLFIPAGDTASTITILMTVLMIYIIDFAINAVQACCRALIVDTLPISQQQQGSAWASRMIAVGNIMGYFAGMVNLRGFFGDALGDTQFKQLMVVSAVMLLVCVGITCAAVKERVLLSRKDTGSGVRHTFKVIWHALFHLPRNIWAICIVLFWAWVGWFPFQVYSTTFVGEVLKRYDTSQQSSTGSSHDKLGEIARVGSTALVLFSCVSLVASVALPWVVESPPSDELHHKKIPSKGFFARCLRRIGPYKPDLTSVWVWGHIFFAGLMFLTLFAASVSFATSLVALSGVAWALMTWAPFSIVGEEIQRLSGDRPRLHGRAASSAGRYEPVAVAEEGEEGEEEDMVEMSARRVSIDLEASSSNALTNELSGVYLGILNIFACLPQMVGSFISFVVFSILEPGKSPEFSEDTEPVEAHKEGVNAIAVCLGIGGVCTLIAAHYTVKFKSDR